MSSTVNKIKDSIADHATDLSGGQHLAAIIPSKGSGLEITHRPTPTPGPNELLIEVKSVALNLVDCYQRDYGFHIKTYPAVLGSDVGGIVISAGSDVPVADATTLKPGTRVSAYTPCFFMGGNPDYGALQKRVLVPAENVVPLPHGISFNEASLLPMSVAVAWAGLNVIGVPRDTAYTPADKKGILVWGGTSSIGSGAVQVASMMGFRVYTTASEKHHEYLKSLGASRVFDYKSENVVENIVKAVKEDGVTLQLGYDAVDQLKPCMDVLKEFINKGEERTTARLAAARPLSEDSPKVEGVEAVFIALPDEPEARAEFLHFVFGVWLKEKLEKGEYVPSPRVRVVDGGLESTSKAMDILKKGVSGVKLVLEI